MTKKNLTPILCIMGLVGLILMKVCAVLMNGSPGKEAPCFTITDCNFVGEPTLKIEGFQQPTFDDLLDAIEWKESEGDQVAEGDNGKAVGAYQLHKIYVDDVNRIIKMQTDDIVGNHNYLPSKQFSYEDRWDKAKSREMVVIYLNHYEQLSQKIKPFSVPENMLVWERMARIHNGGPDGWRKKSTEKYWEKIKLKLEK